MALPGMHRYKLSIQYNGTKYLGWQTQPSDSHASRLIKKSVQSVIEVIGRSAKLTIAGRTDTGVHAIKNVAHIDLLSTDAKTKSADRVLDAPLTPIIFFKSPPFLAQTLKDAINYFLRKHPHIAITSVERTDGSFNARFSAIEREYIYRIINVVDRTGIPFENDRRWVYRRPLNVEKMNTACKMLIGCHDFSTFSTMSCIKSSSPIRHLYEFRVEEDDYGDYGLWFPDASLSNSLFLKITVRAKSFMTHQVRKMVAAVASAGAGKIQLDQIKMLLKAKNPLLCPPMAPPGGLYLKSVTYPPNSYIVYESSAKTLEELQTFKLKARQQR
ncbi:tRNA pseudouridine synthase A-like [Schistocerca gregaria]|uniref:tRNA pseudouridine synthase A-like n=1 Tax=Schistocerca gregaria TaxID=7010 RepID=UPI00211E8C70|nr:tRNA pseudouridine synthase A-like [Schistocerca gregaria]